MVDCYKLDRDQVRHLQTQALYAVELVASTARLCAMNLLLHNLGNEKNIVAGKDSLAAKPTVNYDMVLTNPIAELRRRKYLDSAR